MPTFFGQLLHLFYPWTFSLAIIIALVGHVLRLEYTEEKSLQRNPLVKVVLEPPEPKKPDNFDILIYGHICSLWGL